MKKLLVVLLSAAMVLSMAAVSMAAVTVSGEVSAKYDFESGSDTGEAKITAEAKMNDQLSTKVAFKGKSGDGEKVAVDEWSFTYNPGWATIQVGSWGYKVKGLVDVIDPLYDDFKGDTAVLISKKFDSGFNFGIWWAPDTSALKKQPKYASIAAASIGDNAYVLTAGYTADAFNVNANIISLGDDVAAAYDETGYTVNAALTLSETIIPYISYQDYDNDDAIILGSQFIFGGLTIIPEIDFSNDGAKDTYYGVKVKYAFKSGIYGEYVYASNDDDTAANTIKFGVKFK